MREDEEGQKVREADKNAFEINRICPTNTKTISVVNLPKIISHITYDLSQRYIFLAFSTILRYM